ncbi:hypothetical protein GCM10023142_01630 [Anaerocolumna aminovalerica]|uniref:Peptide maturation system protein, TIGR04066 family n=1 Tax=Anaerocolumna aminovalerica TaxID=1527 RepID=A0A1I5BIA2_9FIRM|nr:TIGR04066 family peptide maturation system protein [Anaerocolumna aminovalerica]MBU5331497.1 TIGR04066 family peptide maturation system protein [Anaerocolumna aminovalerica]SFN74380.1 peptide maturation system protein, TIGR04066 family [Anaerocolumna aminovalerica]
MYNKLLIFPFGKNTSPIVRNLSLLNYDSVSLVSPKSWGFAGKDACIVDGGDFTEVKVSYDFEEELKSCNNILFVFENENITIQSYIDKIQKCIKINKKVFITPELREFLNDSINAIYDNITVLKWNNPKANFSFSEILPIEVPVIIVLGSGDNCNKFDIQLSLRKYFRQNDYIVSQLGTKSYCELMGFKALPKFLFENISLDSKIIALNHYMYDLVKEESPDVFILGVPGGVMPYSAEIPNGFGELAFIITNAVKPDIAIYSTYTNGVDLDSLREMKKRIRYKYDSDIEFINVANSRILVNNDANPFFEYRTIDSNNILNKINTVPTSDFTMFNVLNETSSNLVNEKILESLTNNNL